MRFMRLAWSVLLSHLLLLFPGSLVASTTTASSESIVLRAEQSFRKGLENRNHLLLARRHFSEAADLYLELHRQGCRSSSLYLNLGNAAFLADRWPEALWAYHLGLVLNPNHTLLREHRDFARARVIYPTSTIGHPEIESWPEWLYRPSLVDLMVLSAVAYLLFCFSMTIAYLGKEFRWLILALLLMLSTCALGLGAWMKSEQMVRNQLHPRVIVMENTPFQRGNSMNYLSHPEIALLTRGMEARKLHLRGDWMQIQLSSGEIGWVPSSLVRIVAP